MIKISALPPLPSPLDPANDVIPIVQAGATYRGSPLAVLTAALAGATFSVGGLTLTGTGTALSVANNASVGSLTVGGAATVGGALTLSATGTALSVTNNAQIGGALAVLGSATIVGALTLSASGVALAITNGATIGGALSVGGALSFGASGSFSLPGYASTNRPISTAGEVIWETDTNRLSVFDGAAWHRHVRLEGDTVTGALILSASGTALSVTNNVSIGGALSVAGQITLSDLPTTKPATGSNILWNDGGSVCVA